MAAPSKKALWIGAGIAALAFFAMYVNAGTQLAAVESAPDVLLPGLLGSFVLFGRFRRFEADCSAIPWATFTDPEVARVGLSESEAKEQGIAVEVTRCGFDDLERAHAPKRLLEWVARHHAWERA